MEFELEHLSNDRGGRDESHIELLLSEKLMEGFLLLEKTCPVCATPLVKSSEGGNDDDNVSSGNSVEIKPTLVPTGSFEQPFVPVGGVPFCVSCQSHVITQECEISILERCDSLKNKGSILVALQDGSTIVTDSSTSNRNKKTPREPSIHEEEKKSEDSDQPQQNVIDVTGIEDVEDIQQSVLNRPHEQPTEYVEEPPSASPPVEHAAEHRNEFPMVEHPGEKQGDEHVDEEKDEEAENENTDDVMAEYSVRRQIATKVLGAKMLQGYTLKEAQCDKCGMPMMEFKGKVECVVCPALVKKAKKKLKAQQRQADEAMRLEREIAAKKAHQKEEERRRMEEEKHKKQEEAAIAQQKIRELELAKEKARELEEAEKLVERLQYEREERQRQAEEEVKRRQEADRLRIAALEAEEARLVSEAAGREAEEARLAEEARQKELEMLRSVDFNENERKLVMEKYCRENEVRLLEVKRVQEEKRHKEEIHLQEETRRIEQLQNLGRKDRLSKTENMRADLLKHEYNKKLFDKVRLDNEIMQLEQDRLAEEMESRRLAEERKAKEESMMIQTLEADAADKARAAEKAILKAKAALAHVSTARREIIAQTIAMAEAEAIAEAEKEIKAECEDYHAPTILPSASKLSKERWETLRIESRSVMTRRVMAGWTLLPEFCVGTECENAPLVAKGGIKECTVCGGSGNGLDGAYAIPMEEAVHQANVHSDPDEELAMLRETGIPFETLKASGYADPVPVSKSSSTMQAKEEDIISKVQEVQTDFETKRIMVSKEIGKRMLQGWTMTGTACPREACAAMPLMMDEKGRSNICVVCGPISAFEIKDGSTIENEDDSQPQDGNILRTNSATADVEVFLPVDEQNQDEDNLPSAPTMESTPPIEQKPEPPKKLGISEFLAQSIRQSAQSAALQEIPKGNDPPAFKDKSAPKKEKLDPSDILVSKSDILDSTRKSHDFRGQVAKSMSYTGSGLQVTKSPGRGKVHPSYSLVSKSRSQGFGEEVTKSISYKGFEVEVTKSTTNDAEGAEEETLTLTIPKNFDFNDEAALKSIVAEATNTHERIPSTPVQVVTSDQPDDVSRLTKRIDLHDEFDEETGIIEVTNSGTIFTAADVMSSESILNMFMRSPMGIEAKENRGAIKYDEILDLVQVFVALNFNEKVSDETLKKVARDIVAETAETPVASPSAAASSPVATKTPQRNDDVEVINLASPKQEEHEVIHLVDYPTPEHYPKPEPKRPKAFNFDSVDVAEKKKGRESIMPESASVSSKKGPPTPEAAAVRPKRRPRMPPRPDARGAPRNRIPSPRNRIPSPRTKSPRKSPVVIVGGPGARDHHNELLSCRSTRSGMSRASQASRASNVANDALESILSRIEDCKATMAKPGIDIDTQLKTADLMEKLAAAAVTMQKLEEM